MALPVLVISSDIGPIEERKGHLVPWLPPYYYTGMLEPEYSISSWYR